MAKQQKQTARDAKIQSLDEFFRLIYFLFRLLHLKIISLISGVIQITIKQIAATMITWKNVHCINPTPLASLE
jgi:hypothetical protein